MKEKIYTACIKLLDEKIKSLKNVLTELSEGAKNDAKSSAGDKHETAMAMMQIEQEKISKQLNEVLEQKSALEKIDINISSKQISKGSLIKTDKGFLFLSIALGKINIEGTPVMVLSPQSPLGIKLSGLALTDEIEMNKINYRIEEIH